MKKRIPVLFIEKEECCGCAACYSICTQNAINMEADSEGFLYPMIDEAICVSCQQCIIVCPLKTTDYKKIDINQLA